MQKLQGVTRAEVRSSFITTTVREESQVTPQGRHRQGPNCKPTIRANALTSVDPKADNGPLLALVINAATARRILASASSARRRLQAPSPPRQPGSAARPHALRRTQTRALVRRAPGPEIRAHGARIAEPQADAGRRRRREERPAHPATPTTLLTVLGAARIHLGDFGAPGRVAWPERGLGVRPSPGCLRCVRPHPSSTIPGPRALGPDDAFTLHRRLPTPFHAVSAPALWLFSDISRPRPRPCRIQ